MPTSREDRRVNASPEELNRGWVGKLRKPIETATEYGDLTSNCGALSGYVRKQRRAQKQEESNVSAGIALRASNKNSAQGNTASLIWERKR
jgi:hypothetical protein